MSISEANPIPSDLRFRLAIAAVASMHSQTVSASFLVGMIRLNLGHITTVRPRRPTNLFVGELDTPGR